MNRRLIIPLDGSEAAEAALLYAEAIPSTEVAVLACLPERADTPVLFHQAGIDAERRQMRDAADAYLERVSGTLVRQGRSVERWIEPGEPAERIIANATANDLIVMTTHGFGAGRRAMFGSVTDRVVRYASAPVLVVRGGERPIVVSPIARIVVALDGSDRAERAMPIAAELACDLGVPLYLLRTLDVELLQESLRAGTYASAAWAADIEEIRDAFANYLQDQANRLISRDLRATWAVLEGSPSRQLLAAVQPGDLVVMTSHGRGGLRRWMLGSVAEKLVRLAPVPVLIAR